MLCNTHSVTLASLLIFLVLPTNKQAYANNGGVHGPNVKAGTSSAELRMNTSNTEDARDGREQYRAHYQRALSNNLQVRLVLQYRNFEDFEYDNAKAEFLYNYKKAGSGKYSAGLRLDLRTRRGQRPEDIALHWTHQYNISSSLFARAIAIIDKNVTEDGAGKKPTTIGSRFSLTKKLASGISLGAELYNSYGELKDIDSTEDHQHQLGPTIMYSHQSWYVYARYLHGLTSATEDHNFQFRIGKRF